MVEKPHSRCKLVEPGSREQRALCARPRGAAYLAVLADRQIRRDAWAERAHLKMLETLKREEAEAQREREKAHRFFRVRRQVVWGEEKKGGRKPHVARYISPSRFPAHLMPQYSMPITDGQGRLFVFQRIRYYSAKNTKPGHAKERAAYGIDGAYVFENGDLAVHSNMGETRSEILECVDVVEKCNRAVGTNSKVMFHGIMQTCHLLSPKAQFEAAIDFAEYTCGRQGLPYLVVLHPPSSEGDQRNWHIHFYFSFRPLSRISEGDWELGRHLRTDLDNPEQFKRLRYLWASELNNACEKAGIDRRYTHLSYGASGLDFVPQRHLGEGLTAKVRRGEHVARNLDNHRIAARNAFKRTLNAVRSELVSTVVQTRQTLETAFNSAKIAQAFRASNPIPVASWTREPSHTIGWPTHTVASVQENPDGWQLQYPSSTELSPRTTGPRTLMQSWSLTARSQLKTMPRLDPTDSQQVSWARKGAALTTRELPFALQRGASLATRWSRPGWASSLPPLLRQTGSRRPWNVLHKFDAGMPEARPIPQRSSPPWSSPRQRAPVSVPKVSERQIVQWSISAQRRIKLTSLPMKLTQNAAIKVRFGFDSECGPLPRALPTKDRVNFSALKPPVLPSGSDKASTKKDDPPSFGHEPLSPTTRKERPWLRDKARAGLLKELQEAAVHVERLESGEISPVLIERGLYRFKLEDILEKEMQANLQRMYRRQQEFLARFNPVARSRIGEAQLLNGTKGMIRALPVELKKEAQAWAKTGLWDQIMLDLREMGLRRSEQLIRKWKEARKKADNRRFKLASEAIEQNRRWRTKSLSAVEKALEEDAKVYHQRMGYYQGDQGEGGTPASTADRQPLGSERLAAPTNERKSGRAESDTAQGSEIELNPSKAEARRSGSFPPPDSGIAR